MSPIFRKAKVIQHIDTIIECTDRFIDQCLKTNDIHTDLENRCQVLTTNIIGFDYDLDIYVDSPSKIAFQDFVDHILIAVLLRWLPRWMVKLYLRFNWKYQRAYRQLRELTKQNFSSLNEQVTSGLTESEMFDEVLTAILAGFETTANAIAWFIFYVLRLAPIAGITTRIALCYTTVDNVPIRRGQTVIVGIHNITTDKRYWHHGDPTEFIPEISYCSINATCNGNENDIEGIWYHEMGNACNTHRRIPSIPTNYTGISWQLVFNSSRGIMSIPGMATGINGDIYLFISDDPSKSPEYLVCVTINGLIRWKLYLERDSEMNNIAISNIVSNIDGILFFTISWFKQGTYLNKICRISNAETNNPIEECGSNNLFYQSFQSPLSINDFSVLLFTTLYGQAMAVINATSLQIEWSDRVNLGAINSHYNSDPTGIYWIDFDDHFRKVNGRDTSILDVNINRGGNQYYGYNRQRSVIVRVGQNFTSISASIILSEYDVRASDDFRLMWQWNEPYENNASSTHPAIDDKNGITYLGVLPYLYAIDFNGKTVWKAEITTKDEMIKYNLQTFCLALNTETNIAYIVLSSVPDYLAQSNAPAILFIVPVRMTTGDVLPRMNIKVPSDVTIFVKCPILVGNQILYLPWFVENATDVILLNAIGLPQLSS